MRWLHRAGVTPNQVTLFAVVLSVAAGVAVAFRSDQPAVLLTVPAVLLIRMALNAIDGMLAREFEMRSRLGGVLNEMGDVISDAAIYLPFALVPGCPPALVVVLVILGVISEMAGLLGSTRRYDGPLGKSDRAFAFGIVALLAATGNLNETISTVIFSILVALAGVTIVNRCKNVLKEPAA